MLKQSAFLTFEGSDSGFVAIGATVVWGQTGPCYIYCLFKLHTHITLLWLQLLFIKSIIGIKTLCATRCLPAHRKVYSRLSVIPSHHTLSVFFSSVCNNCVSTLLVPWAWIFVANDWAPLVSLSLCLWARLERKSDLQQYSSCPIARKSFY